ncbi:MAG TPA: hypothetical protein VGQ62_03920 [Chloroflexota bacterium]|nr:hypothetical protein [Chloroflexota bacterium]
MSGRKGLVWVTALTVTSLLLGGGALNALAAERGGKEHGGDSGTTNTVHQKQQPAVVVSQEKRNGDNNNNANHATNNGNSNANADKQRHADDDDLVTKPARVTDESRPGKGCGDDNHVHARSGDCKADDGDEATVETDDDAALMTVADINDLAAATADAGN